MEFLNRALKELKEEMNLIHIRSFLYDKVQTQFFANSIFLKTIKKVNKWSKQSTSISSVILQEDLRNSLLKQNLAIYSKERATMFIRIRSGSSQHSTKRHDIIRKRCKGNCSWKWTQDSELKEWSVLEENEADNIIK